LVNLGSSAHEHGALKIFVGLTVAAGVALAGIQWQRGRIHSATIAAKISAGHLASTNRPAVPLPRRDRTQALSRCHSSTQRKSDA